RDRVGGGGVLAAKGLAVEEELHAGHPHVVRGSRRDRHRAGDRRAGGRGGDRDRRRRRVGRGVRDGDRNSGGGALVAGRVAGAGRQCVTVAGRRGGILRDRVGGGGVLAAQGLAVEEELHPGHAHVVRGI